MSLLFGAAAAGTAGSCGVLVASDGPLPVGDSICAGLVGVTVVGLLVGGSETGATQQVLENLYDDLNRTRDLVNSLEIGGSTVLLDETSGEVTVDELIGDSKKAPATKGKSTIYERPGSMEEANRDFDRLRPENVRDIPGGRAGNLNDGRSVNVRSGSKDGRPTLEVQNNGRSIKFRYGE